MAESLIIFPACFPDHNGHAMDVSWPLDASTPSTHMRTTTVTGTTVLSFTKLCVADLERSARFYTSIVGLREAWRYALPGLQEVVLQTVDKPDGMSLGLMQWDPPRPLVVGHEHGRIGVVTPDVDAFFVRACNLGARVLEEPHAMPEVGVKVGFLADPDGYAVEVVQLLAPGG